MRPENYLKPLCLPFTADFFGLDRESQDALLVLAKIWRDRAAARALLKVIGA
jgi:hypothetical protein